jgi:hypothetical protein
MASVYRGVTPEVHVPTAWKSYDFPGHAKGGLNGVPHQSLFVLSYLRFFGTSGFLPFSLCHSSCKEFYNYAALVFNKMLFIFLIHVSELNPQRFLLKTMLTTVDPGQLTPYINHTLPQICQSVIVGGHIRGFIWRDIPPGECVNPSLLGGILRPYTRRVVIIIGIQIKYRA